MDSIGSILQAVRSFLQDKIGQSEAVLNWPWSTDPVFCLFFDRSLEHRQGLYRIRKGFVSLLRQLSEMANVQLPVRTIEDIYESYCQSVEHVPGAPDCVPGRYPMEDPWRLRLLPASVLPAQDGPTQANPSLCGIDYDHGADPRSGDETP